MKNIYFLIMLLVLTGCVRDTNLYDYTILKGHLDNFAFTQIMNVPIKEGHCTVLTLGDDTIYYGDVSMNIIVPKHQTLTRATDYIKCFYVPKTQNWGFTVEYKGLLMFEDMPSGDNDYNDFIAHINLYMRCNYVPYNSTPIVTISVNEFKPLALGNTLQLGFGYEVRYCDTGEIIDDVKLSYDVRHDFFNNDKGFINTENSWKAYPSIHNLQQEDIAIDFVNRDFGFNWYIEVNGVKYYTAESAKFVNVDTLHTNVLTESKTPFGLFIPNNLLSNFCWMKELSPIWDGYPDFINWIKGKNQNPFKVHNESALYKLAIESGENIY